MNLLLTNDDGFSAPGINALKRRLLLDGHNVMVFAPSENRSGASHCINLGSGACGNDTVSAFSRLYKISDIIRHGFFHCECPLSPYLIISSFCCKNIKFHLSHIVFLLFLAAYRPFFPIDEIFKIHL